MAKRRIEYKVIMVDTNPKDIENVLNYHALDRWHVVGTVHEDRVILEREKTS